MNFEQLEAMVMELDREKTKREAVESYKKQLRKELRESLSLIVAVVALGVSVLAYLNAAG